MSLKVASVAINRRMPPADDEQFKDVQFSIVVMYIDRDVEGKDIGETARYSIHHFENWGDVLTFVSMTPIGSELQMAVN